MANPDRRNPVAMLIFALTFPSLVTFVYFVLLKGHSSSIQQLAYGFGKVIQFGFPIAWVYWTMADQEKREYLRQLNPFSKSWRDQRTPILWGLAFGAVVSIAMVLLYFYWLRHLDSFDSLRANVEEKVRGLQLNSFWAFVALGVFYALCHSFMEEYYWRWFVFSQLQRFTDTRNSILFSSVGFMAHHVILLTVYFGWNSPLTYLFSAGVAIGGGVWAMLYRRSDSLVSPWLSHMIIDAAIFTLGYLIAF